MKRTYSNVFTFKCHGLVTVEELYCHFYEGWPHFLQGFMIAAVMATQRPFLVNVGHLKIRKVEFIGLEEKGEAKINIQTTLNFQGKDKAIEPDNEFKDKMKEDLQNFMKVASDSYQRTFLDSLPMENDDPPTPQEDAEDDE
jgi:hypothetical protein